MKRITLMVTALVFLLLSMTARGKSDKGTVFYALEQMTNCYFYFHYSYPETISELVSFTQYCLSIGPGYDYYNWPDIIEKTVVPKLENDRDKVRIINNEDVYFGILLNNDTLFYSTIYSAPITPCESKDFIGGDWREYYKLHNRFRSPRFFETEKQAIITPHSVDSLFQAKAKNVAECNIEIHNIDKPYKYYVHEQDTIPIYTFWNYKRSKGLHYFCDSTRAVPRSPYYEELEAMCCSFCDSLDIEKVIFLTLDYNKGD